MSLTIRRAAPSDAAVLARFNQGIAVETEGKRLDPDVLALGIRAVFADPARGFYTVAQREDGEIIGQVMIVAVVSDVIYRRLTGDAS